MRINGTRIAEEIVAGLRRMPVPKKRLVAVLVGSDAAAASFVARKAAVARSLGIGFETILFSGMESGVDIARSIQSLAVDVSVGGIVLQLPVPAPYDRDALICAIGAEKDIDNLSGRATVACPAVLAAEAVLASCGKKLADYAAIRIVGNGFLVGAPIAHACAELGSAHMVADITTKDLGGFVRDADLVITGVGEVGLIDPAWLAVGAGVIDFGFPPDLDQEKLAAHEDRLAFYTPTPFGTGPILVAKLFENFYALAQ